MLTIMYQDRALCDIDPDNGSVRIGEGLPLNLYLEEGDSLDTRINNLANFQHWCATRTLTLDRVYAKAILNACALVQGRTDKERAAIALTYKCLSLRDPYWVRTDPADTWEQLNLFDNSLNEAVDVSLRGVALTLRNTMLIARDCSTGGTAPKAWLRREDGFWLLKGNLPGERSVDKETAAAQLLERLHLPVLPYVKNTFHGEEVSESPCYTSKDTGEIPLDEYLENHDLPPTLRDDPAWHRMNLSDYLVGNSDRHWGNISFLFRGSRITGYAPLMDFNHAFEAPADAPSLPEQYYNHRRTTQMAAAITAVRTLHLRLPQPAGDDEYTAYVRERLRALDAAEPCLSGEAV